MTSSGSLDLNSAAGEQQETLTGPMDLGSGGSETGVKVDEQVEKIDVKRVDSEKKGAGDTEIVTTADEEKDSGHVAVADAVGEVKASEEVQPLRLENDVVDDKSMEIGGAEACGWGDQDVGAIDKHTTTAKRRRGRPRKTIVVQDEKKDVFTTTDLVWGKVKSHPWWPAQIFDPSQASEMASTIEKKDHYLVAYFSDKTFAWCDESQLKPFQMYFAQMEKQNSMDSFVAAVSAALEEVSRRIELGMTCHCFMDETNSSIKDQEFENAGLREGVHSYAVDSAAIVSSFDPLKLIDYMQTLAQFPCEELDKLELSIAKSQLKAFYRSKGYSELPIFVNGERFGNDIEASSSKKKKSRKEDADTPPQTSSDNASGIAKSIGSGRSIGKEKILIEHAKKKRSLSELLENETDHHEADEKRSRSTDKSKFDVVDSGKGKKKKLDSLGDLVAKSHTQSPNYTSKFGERMRRVAGQLTGSPPILKSNGETSMKSPKKASHRKSAVDSDPNQKRIPRVINSDPKEISTPRELLSQLCSAARDPLEEYDSLSTIASFINDFRSRVSYGDERKTVVDGGKKPTMVVKSTSSVDNRASTEQKAEEPKRKHQKKQQPADEPAHALPSASMSDTGQQKSQDSSTDHMREVGGIRFAGSTIQDETANPTNSQELEVDLKEVEACMPTALVLTFKDSRAIPAEADLINIFGQYGPLREEYTVVSKSDNNVEVVFKRRSDAELALSNARKSKIFEQALVSYRLRLLELTSNASLSSMPLAKHDTLPAEAEPNTNSRVHEDNGADSEKIQVANG